MIQKILKICNEIPELQINDIVRLAVLLNDLIQEIEHNINQNENLRTISIAAYGLINNPYKNVIYDLTQIKSKLENLIPKFTDINLSILLENFSKTQFKISEIANLVLKANTNLELIKKAYDNKFEIQELAIRFKESEYFKKIYSKHNNNYHYTYLDIVNMEEISYHFTSFMLYTNKTKIEKTDGDKWPILKEIFPEFYI